MMKTQAAKKGGALKSPSFKGIRKKNEQGRTVSIGGISILMVFVMLCLTTFGLLTLSTARAEMRLTQKNAQSVTQYYDVSARMQELLAQIDGILRGGEKQGKTRAELLGELALLEGVSVQDGGRDATVTATLSGEGPVGMVMRLTVDENGNLSIAEYHTQTTVDFSYEEQTQEIWQGD